jgi:putative ABC transport system permease protein
MKDYFALSVRNVERRGIRSWLTLLGVLIGVAAVISLISLGNSLKDTINSQFNIGSTEVISVEAGGISGFGPPGSGVAKPLTEKDAEEIGKISTVEVSIPRNVRTVKTEFNDRVQFNFAATIPDDEKKDYVYELLDLKAEKGRLIGDGDRNVVVLGSNFLDKESSGFEKGIKVGDRISLSGRDFRVQGMLEKKGSFIIDNSILVNEKDLEDLLGYGDEVDLIAVKVISADLMEKTQEDIEKTLRKTRSVKKGEEDFQVSTPQAMLESVNKIILGIQIFVVLIASVSILVGAIGIANTMTTSVLERKREIGIMKAIGARNEHVFYQFFIEAGILGLVGGFLGIALGIGISYLGTSAINDFLGSATKPNFSAMTMILALFGSFAIGAISGVIPAMRAAKENPVEALRK